MKMRLLTGKDFDKNGHHSPRLADVARAAQTDLARMTRGLAKNQYYVEALEPRSPSGKPYGTYWTMDSTWGGTVWSDGNVHIVPANGNASGWCEPFERHGLRPVIDESEFDTINFKNIKKDENGLLTGEFGEYPQMLVDEKTAAGLEKLHQADALEETGKVYTYDCGNTDIFNHKFQPTEYKEYTYKGRKFVRYMSRVRGTSYGEHKREPAWLEVVIPPWKIDEKAKVAVSEDILVSGLPMQLGRMYCGDFEKSFLGGVYLPKYFAAEILPTDDYLKARSRERALAQTSEKNGENIVDKKMLMHFRNRTR